MLGLEMLIIIVKTINYIEHWSQAWFGVEADAKTTTHSLTDETQNLILHMATGRTDY